MSSGIDARPTSSLGQAGADPAAVPLAEIDMSDGELYRTNGHLAYFERLRAEDPVHWCAKSDVGPFWSVTKFEDILTVEQNPEVFSSEPIPFIENPDPDSALQVPGFIAMDGERHRAQRRAVQPVASPRNLVAMEPLVREQAMAILDDLPSGEVFDWVDRISIELTTNMLAIMFDFPWEERRRLTYLSDVGTADSGRLAQMGLSREDREKAIFEMAALFMQLKRDRTGVHRDRLDFVTALANSDATRDLDLMSLFGTIGLLIVGGNDTTRNTISGSVVALNDHPDEYEKLRRNPDLIPTMVDEVIRWQTPLSHMRRTATRDTVLGGKRIKKGDKVVMWYASANRDETAIDRANEFLIDRTNSKHHLSFGWGVHFCMGSRVAELQVRVLWEEILKRFRFIEVTGEPACVRSNLIKGFTELPVRAHRW